MTEGMGCIVALPKDVSDCNNYGKASRYLLFLTKYFAACCYTDWSKRSIII